MSGSFFVLFFFVEMGEVMLARLIDSSDRQRDKGKNANEKKRGNENVKIT